MILHITHYAARDDAMSRDLILFNPHRPLARRQHEGVPHRRGGW